MPVHIVSRVQISRPEEMSRYMKEAPATVYAYGGKYLSRGSAVEALEGSWEHDRMVIVEFPTREAALAWYHSPEYSPLKALRQASSEAVILLASSPP